MIPENKVKLMLESDITKKLQSELPSKTQVLSVSIIQFLIGCGLLSWSIQLNKVIENVILITIILMLGIFIVLMSAYTYFGYLFRKKYLMLIDTLLSKRDEGRT